MNSQPVVEANNISFHYGEQAGNKKAVNQVNVTIEQGSFISIIGHNGSGKSTLAKLLNALLLPTEGTLIVCGYDATGEESSWQIRRHVGMVFQNPDNQLVGTTVEDDVAFGLENQAVDPEVMRVRIDEALRAVHMDKYARQEPHHLSGGQKQRVAIAGIIAMRPQVVIFDEATAMLDPQGRKEVLALARQLHRDEGITVINITHFPEETIYSDRVIVMHAGKIVADGSPRQVYSEVEAMQKIGLDVPFAARIRHQLVQRGIKLPPVLYQEELVEELCKLLSNK